MELDIKTFSKLGRERLLSEMRQRADNENLTDAVRKKAKEFVVKYGTVFVGSQQYENMFTDWVMEKHPEEIDNIETIIQLSTWISRFESDKSEYYDFTN